MKDKREKNKSMTSFMNNMTPVFDNQDSSKEETPYIDVSYDDTYNNKLKKYNDNILTLDSTYSSLKPRNKVLVRVYAKEMVNKGGVLIPTQQRVMMRTQSGYGHIGTMDSPYPYSRKAVVIAVPEYVTDLKSGDIVELTGNPVKAIAIGSGNESSITIPKAYMSNEYPHEEPPTDPENKHFGYLLIDNQEISMIL